MSKTRKCFIIFLTSMVLILFRLYYEVFIHDVKIYVRVNYIASYKINEEMDHMEYYGDYCVGDVKKLMESEDWKSRFGDLKGLRKKLDKLDDNTKMVISLGSGIQYFFLPKNHYEDSDGYLWVKYESKRPKNKIYFYTTDYEGSIVDRTNPVLFTE